VLYLINSMVIAGRFRQHVSSTPLGTVRSSYRSSAGNGVNSKWAWSGKVVTQSRVSTPKASSRVRLKAVLCNKTPIAII
jgi:hypothetical protein